MRIAVLSDIHGNVPALDAVLADARAQGAEEFWVIGDFCAIGPEPTVVLERLVDLRQAKFTRGNTDRYVVTGEGPPPTLDAAKQDPSLVATFAAIAASFAWTRGNLTATGWLEWLERLPLEHRFATPSGVEILAVHASPGNDDGEGIHPGRSNAQLQNLLLGAAADVVLVGHTHEAMLRRVDQRYVVNVGSISNPRATDLRASYVVLELTHRGIALTFRRVAYDGPAFIEAVRRSRHPSAEFILSYQRGEHPGREPDADHSWHEWDTWIEVGPQPAEPSLW